MISVNGYVIKEEVLSSPSKIWLRAIRNDNAWPVILKVPLATASHAESIKELENEFGLFSNQELNRVVKISRKIRLEDNLILELEDHNGMGLDVFLKETTLSVRQKCSIALNLIAVIAEIHHNRIMLRDIKPQSFLINPDTLELKCIDLTCAVKACSLTELPVLEEKFNFNPEYLSPEQTGRISIIEDLRSDLYALGITLYQLFTGQLPFKSEDLNEIIHAHLAREAVVPHQSDPEIPEILSAIILRLLEKKPQDRYQSARSLQHDFKRFQNSLIIKTCHFQLGELDQANIFQVPGYLFGREKEIEQILQLLKRPWERSKIIFLHGNSGSGKSALAAHISNNIPDKNILFVSGKCDQQLQQNPFGAVTQALKQLVSIIDRGPENERLQWKQQIVDALGNSGRLITSEIPELEAIIGIQPEIPVISSADALNRNVLVFTRFIHVFANSEHLLVIFLDDLQWADGGTLNFIRSITKESKGLIIIGSYRENDLTHNLPFQRAIEEIKHDCSLVKDIPLQALNTQHIQQLLSETFSCPVPETISLADVIFTKTLGNPLFVNQYLHSLHEEDFITYNHKENKWEWDLAGIHNSSLLSSSAALINRKIESLPADTRLALSYAACFGIHFRLDVLAALMDSTAHETAENLKPAVNEALILISRSENTSKDNSFTSTILYAFSHDQIQQVAYALLTKELKQELHLNIGYILLDKSSNADVEKNCFEIAGHLNKGYPLITDIDDVFKIAGLNLNAGKKAKASTAFSVAFDYFNTGIQYLKEHQDNNDLSNLTLQNDKKADTCYVLTLSLYMQAAETAYLTGQFEKTNSFISSVLKIARTQNERIEAVLLQIQSLIYQKENENAIYLAVGTIQSLGIKSLPLGTML